MELRCLFFYNNLLTFCSARDIRSLQGVWETCESTFGSRPEDTCAVRPKKLHILFIHHFSREKWHFSLLLMWFSFWLKQDYKPTAGTLALAKTCQLAHSWKTSLLETHLSWVVAIHITSFKKQNENTTITQAWKQMSYYYCYVLDTLTSAELRKLASNKDTNCKGSYCWLLLCSC